MASRDEGVGIGNGAELFGNGRPKPQARKIRGITEQGTRENEMVWIRGFSLLRRATRIFNRHVC